MHGQLEPLSRGHLTTKDVEGGPPDHGNMSRRSFCRTVSAVRDETAFGGALFREVFRFFRLCQNSRLPSDPPGCVPLRYKYK